MSWLSLDWVSSVPKIPVGQTAKLGFDWLKAHGTWLFDGLSNAMETLIDTILWVLQSPHPLVIIAVFVAVTWVRLSVVAFQ